MFLSTTECLELGCTPYDEPCAQVGSDDYYDRAKIECRAYINQLKRSFPIPSEIDAWYSITSNPHDFGDYYDVVIKYDESNDDACNFAQSVDDNLPANWDTEALQELKAKLHK